MQAEVGFQVKTSDAYPFEILVRILSLRHNSPMTWFDSDAPVTAEFQGGQGFAAVL